jgi:Kelch motif/Galactose oxidase, central domain
MRRLLAVPMVALGLAVGTPHIAGALEPTTREPPMLGAPKTEVAGAHWDAHGLVAVAGGFTDDSMPTPDLVLLDVASGEWTRGPDLPGNRDHAALVALGDSLYLVGGFTTGLTNATANVWVLATPDGEWEEVAPMGTARGALGAAAIDGRILAVGGVDERGRDLASTEWYDPATDTWTQGPALSRTRQHLAVAARGDTVYAIGGRSPNLDTVERLRFAEGTPAGRWRRAPSLGFSRSGNGAATAGVVCTAGGEEDAGTIAPIECLRGGRWRHVADLEVPRHGLAVVAVDDELHVISGGPEPGFAFSRVHEVYRPTP